MMGFKTWRFWYPSILPDGWCWKAVSTLIGTRFFDAGFRPVFSCLRWNIDLKMRSGGLRCVTAASDIPPSSLNQTPRPIRVMILLWQKLAGSPSLFLKHIVLFFSNLTAFIVTQRWTAFTIQTKTLVISQKYYQTVLVSYSLTHYRLKYLE